ncbi:Phospholipase D zeta 1 [Linum perenne]
MDEFHVQQKRRNAIPYGIHLKKLSDDGSQAQWFIDGRAAFEPIASTIEDAKSEWLCPELYLRRPFQNHASSRLDALLEAKAKQGVQRNKAPYEEAIPLLMPQQHMVIPHYMGNSSPVEIKSKNADGSVRIPMQDPSSRSSFQDIPLFLPQEPEELDGSSGGPKSNGVESTTSRASNSLRKAKVAPLAPEMPMKSFVDDHDSSDLRGKISRDWTQPSIRPSDLEWWETQERGDQIGSGDETGEVGPQAFCQCQVYA